MPLEPRQSEACRSCQPMHVLSFGEGRNWMCFCFFHKDFGPHAFGVRNRFLGMWSFVCFIFVQCVFLTVL